MIRSPLALAFGFLVWASAFVALYAMLSIGCRFGWHEIALAGTSVQRLQLIAILMVHAAAGGAVVFMVRQRIDGESEAASFMRHASHAAAVAALVSTLFSFFAVFFLTECY
jgi:hypothetical protein